MITAFKKMQTSYFIKDTQSSAGNQDMSQHLVKPQRSAFHKHRWIPMAMLTICLDSTSRSWQSLAALVSGHKGSHPHGPSSRAGPLSSPHQESSCQFLPTDPFWHHKREALYQKQERGKIPLEVNFCQCYQSSPTRTSYLTLSFIPDPLSFPSNPSPWKNPAGTLFFRPKTLCLRRSWMPGVLYQLKLILERGEPCCRNHLSFPFNKLKQDDGWIFF